jgi:hypothetical protein
MIDPTEPERTVRIGRPAFQDFHRLLPRYYARSELNRQLQKLKWWRPQDSLVIDLAWNNIAGTPLCEVVFERCDVFAAGLRVVFFPHTPMDVDQPSVWVLGGVELTDEFDDIRKTIYVGRSLIVQERATE